MGFKSEAIYEEIGGFRVLLKVELYFGNLCDDTLLNLKLDFKGDQSTASSTQIFSSMLTPEKSRELFPRENRTE